VDAGVAYCAIAVLAACSEMNALVVVVAARAVFECIWIAVLLSCLVLQCSSAK